jgi:hypothetical protein
MSTPPRPPERLAEILQEILALSDLSRPGKSESIGGGDRFENLDTRGDEQSRQQAEEDDSR